MSAHSPEIADVIRQSGAQFEARYPGLLTIERRCTLKNLANCRTAALGGHRWECAACGQIEVAYNSCRDRHCPKCQASARAEWFDARQRELLPVPYFHVVFTLPEPAADLARQNRRELYGLLFRAASETLREVAANPRHLGAKIGVLAVLHTWGQTLTHHPHVHCVIPGGGLSPDGARWVRCRPKFFLPVRVLSRLFRGKFLAGLIRLRARGRLTFAGRLSWLQSDAAFRRWCRKLSRSEWVVYAKRPFGGPQQVLKYLARYTHRVAISNQRLLRVEDGEVEFRYKDYARGESPRTMTLSAVEFLRRFMDHILPKGFMRIRYYGLLSNPQRGKQLARCRELLAADETPPDDTIRREADELVDDESAPDAQRLCPHCGVGVLVCVESTPRPRLCEVVHFPWVWDSS